MKNLFSLLIGCLIGLGIIQLIIGDWLPWKLSNIRKKGVTYEMFYLMRHPNEILKTPYEAIKIIYGEDGYCLIKKPTYQEGDEIKLMD